MSNISESWGIEANWYLGMWLWNQWYIIIQKFFQVCLLSVKNTLFQQIRKFVQNSGKEYMTLGTTEARPTQKEKLPGRPETWKGQQVYMGSSATLWYQHCDASKQPPQRVMLQHKIPLYFGKGLAPVSELFALWLLPLIPARFPLRTWISAVRLVQTEEVTWTSGGEWGWKRPSAPWECSVGKE